MEVVLQFVQQIVTIIKDVFTCLAAIIASAVAVLGLRAWRIQLKGKTEYEIAQRLLKSVYRVRNAIAQARVPFPSDDELDQAIQTIDVDNEGRANLYRLKETVYQKRRQTVLDALVEMDSSSLEAEVFWEQDVRENLRPLNQCAERLFRGIQNHLNPTSLPIGFDEGPDETTDIIYDWTGEPDESPFSKEVYIAVSQAENFIKPHLKI